MHLPTCADEELAQCQVCQAFGEAPRALAQGAPTPAMPNGKLQADLPFLDDVDFFSKYSLLIPVRTETPHEVWDVFRGSWIRVFGPPLSVEMDGGAE